jgi:hypothetical protein
MRSKTGTNLWGWWRLFQGVWCIVCIAIRYIYDGQISGKNCETTFKLEYQRLTLNMSMCSIMQQFVLGAIGYDDVTKIPPKEILHINHLNMFGIWIKS